MLRKQSAFVFAITVAALAPLFCGSTAQAQATRTWVSGVGDDVNPCSRTAPCKTFAGAISKTAPSGIINCLDSGGFGSVTITKSITIDCRPILGGLLAAQTNGVNVNGAGIVVTLRGLDIEGAGTGLIGVNFINGAVLVIEDSKIYGFQSGSARGVSFVPASGTTAQLHVVNTSVSQNGVGGTGGGIFVQGSGTGNANFSIDRSHLMNNATGLVVLGIGNTGTARGTISNSTAVGSTNDGILVQTTTGPAFLMVENTVASHNGTNGIQSNGAASQVLVSQSTITGNTTGVLQASAGQMFTYHNNFINGNTVTQGVPSGGLTPE